MAVDGKDWTEKDSKRGHRLSRQRMTKTNAVEEKRWRQEDRRRQTETDGGSRIRTETDGDRRKKKRRTETDVR
jgi:hypothetical protein